MLRIFSVRSLRLSMAENLDEVIVANQAHSFSSVFFFNASLQKKSGFEHCSLSTYVIAVWYLFSNKDMFLFFYGHTSDLNVCVFCLVVYIFFSICLNIIGSFV